MANLGHLRKIEMGNGKVNLYLFRLHVFSLRLIEEQHSRDSYHIHVQFLLILMPYIEMTHLLLFICWYWEIN